MSPYRKNADPLDQRQAFGFIKAPKPAKPHICDLPGTLSCWWNDIHRNSLWRCSCGSVWRYNGSDWMRTPLKTWLDMGGVKGGVDKDPPIPGYDEDEEDDEDD